VQIVGPARQIHAFLELGRRCPRRDRQDLARMAGAGDPLQLLERDFQAEIRAPALAAITG